MRFLLISDDVVGQSMAGPGIRYWELSRAMAARHDVTLAAPMLGQPPSGDSRVRLVDRAKSNWMDLVAQHDVVVVQKPRPRLAREVRKHDRRLVVDAYYSDALEGLEIHRHDPMKTRTAHSTFARAAENLALRNADG